MLDAIHGDTRAKHVAEHIQFGAAEALAGRGGRADRAMVLQQQEAAAIGAPFSHVAFARTGLRETRHAGAQRGCAGDRGRVGVPGLLLA